MRLQRLFGTVTICVQPLIHYGKRKIDMNVLLATIPGMIDQARVDRVGQIAHIEEHIADNISEDDLAEKCADFDILMLNYDIIKKLSPQFYQNETVRNLKAISTDITGMDWASPEAAAEAGVLLQNIPNYSTQSVAETMLAEVLLHSRERHRAYIDQIRGRHIEGRQGINLKGRTAGILGYGDIGKTVYEMLSALGMHCLVWNYRPKNGLEITQLEDIFSRADVICVCVKTVMDGDHANVGFINASLLSNARQGILINLASVHVVNHDDIAEAIKKKHIRGYSVERHASLDGSEILEMDEVHIPPSNSWKSPESLENLQNTWVENTISVLKGCSKNVVTAK
jgi:phosphoglycerate dehydrogenase-like enzyme